MLHLLLLSLFDSSSATPSVWQCPINLYGPMSPFDPNVGEICPGGSFLHYYACCSGDPFACCFYFEPWFIVVLVVLAFLLAVACLFALACGLLRYRRREEAQRY